MQKNFVPPDIRVRRSPLDPRRGILAAGSLRLPCALGRSGTTVFKREGDGATPVASMDLLGAYVRSGRLPGLRLHLPTLRSRPDSGWCDAPTHPAYNRPVRLPFPASTETLQRQDRLYDLVVVLDWNIRRRQRGMGSAIFLHIAREGYAPTEGCVAVSPADMRRLAPLLRKGGRLTVSR
jgi:L,D-peptidoglycan transpeptidase YkuD (ErfK/YbiS/YcfS/YnhG family)